LAGGDPHPPTPQDPEWVPPHTPYPLTSTNNYTFFPNPPPSNYACRSLQKYILCKVNLESTVPCNSLEPNIHAASQPFRYVSAGSTYCHFDPFSVTPPPAQIAQTSAQCVIQNTPRVGFLTSPLHKDIFMCYICPNCRRSLR